MEHPKLRGGLNALGWLLSMGVTVSGVVVPAVGYSLLALMLPVSVWTFWPWIRRWRPFTLVPVDGDSRAARITEPVLMQLRERNEQLEQLNNNLEAERKQLSDVLQDTKRENTNLKQERDELKQENEKLRIELNNRPPRHFTTPGEIVDAPSPATTKVLEQVRSENEQLKQQNEKQQQQLGRWDGDRLKFKELVMASYDEGVKLRESEPSEEEARDWAERVRNLLEAALGEYWADSVVKDDADFRTSRFGSTTEQKWVESRVNRLYDHIYRKVESGQPIPFRSGFDPHEWKDWKSPPPLPPKVQLANLTARLGQAEQERGLLRQTVQELEKMSPEEFRTRQDERRKRIEKWRSEIQKSSFIRTPRGVSQICLTETYAEMKPYLLRDVRDRLGSSSGAVGAWLSSPHLQGTEGDKRVMLGEVARIEKEWGVF